MKNWTYIFDGDTYGIVKTPTEKEAKQKVLKAYTEHGGYQSEITENMIIIKQIDNRCFSGNPDVIEVVSTDEWR